MRRGVSDLVKKMVIEKMIEEGLEKVVQFGITFSTEKRDGSFPTGQTLKDGRMIYIQP